MIEDRSRDDAGQGTSQNPQPGRRFGSASVPIRLKLVAVLVLPLTLLVILGLLQVIDARRDAREAREEARLAVAVTGPGSFLAELINERNHTAVYLLGAEDLISSVEPGQYLETRQLVNDAWQEFATLIEGQNEQVQAIYEPTLRAMDRLEELRTEVDNSQTTRDFGNVDAVQNVFERIGEVSDPLFAANRQISLTVNDAELQRGTAIIDQSLRQSDTIALLTYQLVVSALAGDQDGPNTPEEHITGGTALRDLREGEETLRLHAEGDYAQYVDALFASEHIQKFPELVEEALYTGAPDVSGLFANAGDEDAFGYDKLRAESEALLTRSSESISSSARTVETYLTLFGVIVLLAVLAVTTVVAWSITRPLRSLTQQAIAMCEERLPRALQGILETPLGEDVVTPHLPPISVRTRDEVANVAEALDTVQNSALELAAEQATLRRNIADSFVYLGRRNQSLLGRQLDFITELEQGETDPNALSNLFRLDHLATRMRRNAESLLLLAGIEPPRTWRSPVPLTDVIRASLGEVEDYQRVAVREVEAAHIAGSAAADLAHLLAELLENALTFSPPNQFVEIRGRHQPVPAGTSRQDEDEGHALVYTLTVVDSGVGMTEKDIERANMRLAGQESFTVAPSRYLGHYVAGMIASRHGISVKLQGARGRGLTATVALPAQVLTSQRELGSGVPSSSQWIAPGSQLPPPQAAPMPALAPTGSGPAAPVHVGSSQMGGTQVGGQEAGAPGALQPLTMGSYRVGDTEFQIDFGSQTSGAFVSGEHQDVTFAQGIPPGLSLAGGPGAPPPGGAPGGPGTPGGPPAPGGPAVSEAVATAAAQQLTRGWLAPRPRVGQRVVNTVPTGAGAGPGAVDRPSEDPNVTPEERQEYRAKRARHVRDALSSFSAGLQRGRGVAAREYGESLDGGADPSQGEHGGQGEQSGQSGPRPPEGS